MFSASSNPKETKGCVLARINFRFLSSPLIRRLRPALFRNFEANVSARADSK